MTGLAMASVDEHEMASGAGLMNFLRTLSGAFATSLITTQWDEQITRNHAELVGLADSDRSVQSLLESSGMAPDAVPGSIDQLINGQAVMLATNQIMTVVGLRALSPRLGHLVSAEAEASRRCFRRRTLTSPEHSTGHIMFKHLLVPTDGTEFFWPSGVPSHLPATLTRITFLNIEHAFPAMYLGEGNHG